MLFRPIMDPSYPSRRTLLKGSAALTGALVIGVATGLGTRRVKAAADVPEFDPPARPDAFIRIDADDTVTVLIKHLDMGQGIATGLTTIVAEELDAAWEQMRFDFAPRRSSPLQQPQFRPDTGNRRFHRHTQLLDANAQGRGRRPRHAGRGCCRGMGRFAG